MIAALAAAALLGTTPPAPRLERASAALLAELDGAVLALAAASRDRLLVLTTSAVALHDVRAPTPTRLATLPLPRPVRVRAPAGLLVGGDGGPHWALTAESARAVLVAVEDDRLVARETADALPWAGAVSGLRYRSGTNLIEGLAGGPVLAIASGVGTVDAAGILRRTGGSDVAGPAPPRSGTALASLPGGWAAASLPVPPGQPDAILLLAPEGTVHSGPATEGMVRALAFADAPANARLFAAVERSDGTTLLVTFRVEAP